jgi:hypothetical protein
VPAQSPLRKVTSSKRNSMREARCLAMKAAICSASRTQFSSDICWRLKKRRGFVEQLWVGEEDVDDGNDDDGGERGD